MKSAVYFFYTRMSEHKTEFDVRLEVANNLRANGVNPYPADSNRNTIVGDFFNRFKELHDSQEARILAGRVLLKREHGKLIFLRLRDASGDVQIVVSSEQTGEVLFDWATHTIGAGDIIECTGVAFITKKGEQSLLVSELRILTKALQPLPDKWHGIQDDETKLRKRYIDLLLRPELRDVFIAKARFWNATRQFLLNDGFLEVETPVLENTTGGADATPFMTHHNALDIDVYLRISMGELWQKRLMVAGFEKTFEIGRQFRNEGMSPEHLQDYSQMECYWAYADYTKGMDFVKRMYRHIIKETLGTLQCHIRGFDIDFEKEWEIIDYATAVEQQFGVNVLTATEEELRAVCARHDILVEAGSGKGRLIDSLWKQCRKKIAGPALLINHPVSVSPLAKRHSDNPEVVERFQVIIAGSEVGNGYSELNDPIDQRERFEHQAELRAQGDGEAQMNDEEFVEALEHGMPPTFGFGFSERLFSFLMDMSIRDAVLFPLYRPKHGTAEPATTEEVTISAEEVAGDASLEECDPGITRAEADAWMEEKIQSDALRYHNRAVGEQMAALAERFGAKNPEAWYVAGVLHDIDYESCHPDSIHTEHAILGAQWLTAKGIDPVIVRAVELHNPHNNSGDPHTLLAKALRSCEQVTGLIAACVAVRPDKDIAQLELKSVKKKLKDKSFARGVDREWIQKIPEWLPETSVDDVLELTIRAMQQL